MTLLTICQDAIGEIGGFSTQSVASIVTNSDPTARQLFRLANKVGKALTRDYDWNILKTDYTFATVAGTDNYALPSDFKRFSNITFWDRTNEWPLLGPVTDLEWQTLQSGLNTGGSRYWFSVRGGRFHLYPVPQAAQIIAYTYYSKNWCQSSDGATKRDAFAADTDTSRLDEDLITRGLIFEFKNEKGLPSVSAQADYITALNQLRAADSPRGIIDFGGVRGVSRWPTLPDGSFG